MLKTISTLVLFLNSIILFSQSSFTKGYVVSHSNDTIKGLIENNDWKVNPSKIRFKQTESADIMEYDVTNAKSFYLGETHELYEAMTIVLDESPQRKEKLTPENFNSKAEKSVFALVLVKGHASLFHIYDIKPHHVLQMNGAAPQELILQKRPYRGPSGRVEKLEAFPLYKGILNLLFNDCPSLAKKIRALPFRLNAIKNIVVEYNTCKNSEMSFVQQDIKAKNEFGVTAGLSMTTHSITGKIQYQTNATYDPAFSPSFGIYLNHVFPRNNQKYSWYSEILYKSFHVTSTYEETNLYRTIYNNNSNIDMIRLFSGVRFRFNHSTLRPFLSAGLNVAWAIKTDVFTKIDRYQVDGDFYDSSIRTFSARNFDMGVWLGAGVGLTRRMNLEVRADKSAGYLDAMIHKAHVTHYYLMASYSLGK